VGLQSSISKDFDLLSGGIPSALKSLTLLRKTGSRWAKEER